MVEATKGVDGDDCLLLDVGGDRAMRETVAPTRQRRCALEGCVPSYGHVFDHHKFLGKGRGGDHGGYLENSSLLVDGSHAALRWFRSMAHHMCRSLPCPR